MRWDRKICSRDESWLSVDSAGYSTGTGQAAVYMDGHRRLQKDSK